MMKFRFMKIVFAIALTAAPSFATASDLEWRSQGGAQVQVAQYYEYYYERPRRHYRPRYERDHGRNDNRFENRGRNDNRFENSGRDPRARDDNRFESKNDNRFENSGRDPNARDDNRIENCQIYGRCE